MTAERRLEGTPAEIKAQAERTRQLAAQRTPGGGTTSQEGGQQKITALDMIVETDMTKAEAYDAELWLKREQEAEAQRQKDTRVAMSEDYLFALVCKGDELHAGLYFTGNPFDKPYVGDNDWYSTYKPQNEAFRDVILCQVCLKKGIERGLHINYVDKNKGRWTPVSKWVFAIPRDAKRRAIERPFRVARSEFAAANHCHAEHEKQLAKAKELGLVPARGGA